MTSREDCENPIQESFANKTENSMTEALWNKMATNYRRTVVHNWPKSDNSEHAKYSFKVHVKAIDFFFPNLLWADIWVWVFI